MWEEIPSQMPVRSAFNDRSCIGLLETQRACQEYEETGALDIEI